MCYPGKANNRAKKRGKQAMDKWIMNQISKYCEGERQAALDSGEGYGLPERALQN